MACHTGKFSASKISKEAFLSIQCIWPKRALPNNILTYISNLSSFFDKGHANDALKLIDRKLLGLEKLDTLYQIIYTQEKPHLSTPPQKLSGTLADRLGPFSILSSLLKQIADKSFQASADKQEVRGAPKKNNVYDIGRAPLEETSPTKRGLNPEKFKFKDTEMADTDNPPENQPENESGNPPPESSPSYHWQTSQRNSEEPPRRTPTETLVADFMVILLGGLASFIQALGPRPLCIANSFETTYQFGPIHEAHKQENPAQFRARIDGSIPLSIYMSGIPREAAIFEVKHDVHDEKNNIPVVAQQTMEHTAFIWKLHREDSNIIHSQFSCQPFTGNMPVPISLTIE